MFTKTADPPYLLLEMNNYYAGMFIAHDPCPLTVVVVHHIEAMALNRPPLDEP